MNDFKILSIAVVLVILISTIGINAYYVNERWNQLQTQIVNSRDPIASACGIKLINSSSDAYAQMGILTICRSYLNRNMQEIPQ